MTGMENIVKSVLHFHICQEALLQTALPILVTCYPANYEHLVFFDSAVYKNFTTECHQDLGWSK